MADILQGSSDPVPGAQPQTSGQVVFDGSRWPLFRLLLANLLLTVLTLGFYRFWAKTRVRRFFWRHVRVLGEPLEYLGTGLQLLIGFLIALLVLAPVTGIYTAASFLLVLHSSWAATAAEAAFVLSLLFLAQFVVHRVRRYRLTQTAWRGIRFGLDGSSLRYAVIASGYGLLNLATLGLAYPWLRVATLSYFVNNARFGTTRLGLDASARRLFRDWLPVVLAAPLAIGLFVVLNLDSLDEAIRSARDFADPDPHDSAESGGAGLRNLTFWPLIALVAAYPAWIRYRVVEFRHLASNVRLGDVMATSRLGAGRVLKIVAIYWLLVLAVVLGAAGLVLLVLAGAGTGGADGVWYVVAAVGLVMLGAFPLLKTLYLHVALLRHACETMSLTDEGTLDRIARSADRTPIHGEGLADALDIGGF